jgi:ankyrin repeat protein
MRTALAFLAAVTVLFSRTLSVAAAVPGETLAPEDLQRSTQERVLARDEQAARKCHSRQVVRTAVTEAQGKVTSPLFSSNPGAWQEHWDVDRCGTIVTWEVHFLPSTSGGIDVVLGLAGPTKPAPTAPSGVNADLIAAAEKGDAAQMMTALENGANVDTRDARQLTPLLIASLEGHADVVEVLLNKGSDPKLTDKYGGTAMHRAAFQGRDEVIKVLLAHGVDVNLKSGGPGFPVGLNGETPLIEAASGHVETVRLLIDRGADVNARNAMGQTALIRAAMNGESEVILSLLQHGADPSIRDSQGHFALADAGRRCPSPEACRALIERSKDNIQDLNNALFSVSSGHGPPACLTFIELLLDNGADVNARTEIGSTPLMGAARWGPKEFVELLLSRGADATLKNKKGHRAEDDTDTPEIHDLLKAARLNK